MFSVDKCIIKIYHQNSLIDLKNTKVGGVDIMKSFLKKIAAIVAVATLVLPGGLFGVQVKAAGTAPSHVSLAVSAASTSAGGTISITTTYLGDTATSIKFYCFNPNSAYDYNLYSYGYTGGLPYYVGIGSFTVDATNLASGAVNTISVPSSAYGNYTVVATVTNPYGSQTGSSDFFVNNTTLDTSKPMLTSVTVGSKTIGDKKYIEIVATASDSYTRTGQTSSNVSFINVAFENQDKLGTWTNTISLMKYNDVYYGRLDESTIKEPGTYVLNYAQIADSAGNVATYKKSGNTLVSSSYDKWYFPDDLNKKTFSIGEVAGKNTADKEAVTETAQPGADNASPKTSENGAMLPALAILMAMLLSGMGVVVVLAKHNS